MKGCSSTQDEPTRRHARSTSYEHVRDVRDLVHGGAAHLAHSLRDAVHAVQVRLAELTAMCIGGKAPLHLEVAIADEILRLTTSAETELFELRQHERREVVVDDGDRDVVGTQSRAFPE